MVFIWTGVGRERKEADKRSFLKNVLILKTTDFWRQDEVIFLFFNRVARFRVQKALYLLQLAVLGI